MGIVKQRNFILLASVVLFLSLILGSMTGTVFAKENKLEYPVNKSGQTYGSSLYSEQYGGEPDLIAAVNEDGVQGYMLKTDVDGPMPKTREEALAMMYLSIESGGRTIPLYEADGKTILGEFKIDPPMIKECTVDELKALMEEAGMDIEWPETE